MSSQALRDYVNHHLGSVTVLAALGVALEAEVTANPLQPALQARIDDVLDTIGLAGTTKGLSEADFKSLLAEIRFNMLLDAKFLLDPASCLAWAHSDTEILQAGGEISAGFAGPLRNRIVPGLAGLAERLDSSDASFLDVGVGVAGLSIAMMHLWPSLRVIGIDPWWPALNLAEENVRRAGLTDRIQLRHQSVEDLSEIEAFDLAWLPSAFIPSKLISVACEKIYQALRPGGWLLFAMAHSSADSVTASLVRLRTALWGGCPMTPAEVEILLRRTGLADVRALPSPPGAIMALVAGRRSLP
jgi:SAM-dependent methyltransferase